jgi:hypothetical protein
MLLAFAAICIGSGATATEPFPPPEHPILFVQEYVGPASGDEATVASRIVLLNLDGTISILTDGFARAADPCLSFDSRRVVFAGKLAETDRWNIWEMDLDGSRKTPITVDQADCREPVYLPRAAVDSPGFKERVRWITFTSTAPGVLDDQGDAALTSLYAMNLDPVPGRGTVLWRTSYNLGGDISPTVLADGRVLFSSRQRGAFALMTISWGGENLNPFYGSHDGAISQLDACELADRTVVFIESVGIPRHRGGRLARVSLRRPLHSHEVLSAPTQRYRTPHPYPDAKLLVSFEALYADGESYAIAVFDPEARRIERVLYDDPSWNDVDAIAVIARPEPRARIPMVEFASVLDVGALRAVGQLQCLNVYDSDRPGVAEIERGAARAVRLVEGVPIRLPDAAPVAGNGLPQAARADSTWPPPGVETRVLGEAEVEEDGSFYLNVAGDVPFYLQTLDAEGRALTTMRAWIWVRAGDQRGCIGCHEEKELAPENRATQALVRARPAMLTAPPEERPTFTFEKDVMPIIEQRCSVCHAPGTPAAAPWLLAEPDGPFNRAYTWLLGTQAGRGAAEEVPYVRMGESRRSPLVDLLTNEHGEGEIAAEDVRTIITWIDLGARWGERVR